MQKLLKATCIASLTFIIFTINAATISFDEQDMAPTVIINGPGLELVRVPACIIRSYDSLTNTIKKAYSTRGLGEISSDNIGSIKFNDAPITAATNLESLREAARAGDVNLCVTIAADVFAKNLSLPIPHIGGFFDDKDLKPTVFIDGPGLNPSVCAAWRVRSWEALQTTIIDIYNHGGHGFTISPEDIGSICINGENIAVGSASVGEARAVNFTRFSEMARSEDVIVSVTIAPRVFAKHLSLPIPPIAGFFDVDDLTPRILLKGAWIQPSCFAAWRVRSREALQTTIIDIYNGGYGFTITPTEIVRIYVNGEDIAEATPAYFTRFTELARREDVTVSVTIAPHVFGI